MTNTFNQKADIYTITLTAEELNAILSAFDAARKVNYESPQPKFIEFANTLHDELCKAYVEC